MKKSLLLSVIVSAFVSALISCSIEEPEICVQTPLFDDFYASVGDCYEASTKTYTDSRFHVLWHEDDRISIFNKNTFNQQYCFNGNTGDNAGSFSVVPSSDFYTANPIDNVYAVYPYSASTRISNNQVLTVNYSSEQQWAENSIGKGANLMVACTSGQNIIFKNTGAILIFKLWGDDVSVSSIKLKSNAGEAISGKATVSMPLGGLPAITMSSDASDELSLVCNTPVSIGTSNDNYTEFWMIVPPVHFINGFTITVTDSNGKTFSQSTSKTIAITRNTVTRMAPFEVKVEKVQPDDEIWYTTSNSAPITYYAGYSSNDVVSNTYKNGKGVMKFSAPVTEIADKFFESRGNLISISLPSSLTRIGQASFNGCTNLTTIDIPQSVSVIGASAFAQCYKLKSFTGKFASSDGRCLIQDGVLWAFAPDGLESYSIPEGVTTIMSYTFWNIQTIKSLSLPQSITSISDGAISGCGGLEAFYGRFASEDHRCLADNHVIKAFAPSGLTSYIIPDGTKEIAKSAFSGCKNITSFEVPSSVETLGRYAFDGCSNLTDVILSEGLKTISLEVFRRCKSLKEITIPSTVSKIYSWAFWECSSLAKVTVLAKEPPTSQSDVFMDCPALTAIYVPASSVESYKNTSHWSDYAGLIQAMPVVQPDNEIWYTTTDNNPIVFQCGFDSSVFFGSELLSNTYDEGRGVLRFAGSVIRLGEKYHSPEERPFANNLTLKSLSLPSSVRYIQSMEFYGCHVLERIDLPEEMDWIASFAFDDCVALKELKVPLLLKHGPNDAYPYVLPSNIATGCKSLERFYGPYASADGRYLVIDDVLFSIAPGGLTSFTVPEGIKTIYGQAFLGCDLETIILPSSLEEMKIQCFSECEKLKSIVIPAGVKVIGQSAFYGDTAMESITVLPTSVPTLDSSLSANVFYTGNKCPIYVPAESLSAYKADESWSYYSDRLKPLIDYVDLGLSVKWASYNIGASKPSELGDYFAWGETETKFTPFLPTNYKWADELGEYNKYFRRNWETGTVELAEEDDAAAVQWGGGWRIPRSYEVEELCSPTNCTFKPVTIDGVKGMQITSKKNGNSIFLPSGGHKYDTTTLNAETGCYWSSSLDYSYDWVAKILLFYYSESGMSLSDLGRSWGALIRPVHE